MKFHFRSIGPIREAEIEFGDLTILAGRNNTGKTYLAYALYGFLKSWQGWPAADSLLASNSPIAVDRRALRELVAGLAQTGEARWSVDRATLERERSSLIAKVAQAFSEKRLASVFSSRSEDFAEARLEVDFDSSFPEAVPRLELPLGRTGGCSIEYDGVEIIARSQLPARPSMNYSVVLSFLYFRLLLAGLPDPFILSAERFGISLFYKELDFTKNQLVDLLQKLRDGKESDQLSPFLLIDKTTSRYALPIKDNIDFTRGIAHLKNRHSEIRTENLSGEIKDLMEGYYTASDDELRFVSKRRGNARFNIPLHLASSSARGLSDFYFFLRHVARRDQLLIVDEPESHLDTGNQVGLARLLSKLVRTGVRVLVTTHSDYLVKEINNLLMLHHLDPQERLPKELGITRELSLDPDRVLAYVTEGGTANRCSLDRYGIAMPNFEKTIHDINRRSYELAERIRPATPPEDT